MDETYIAIGTLFARAMAFYYPNKLKGKHHLKFYTLCENDHCCDLFIKMYHKNKKEKTLLQTDIHSDTIQLTNNAANGWERTLSCNVGDDRTIISNEEGIKGCDL